MEIDIQILKELPVEQIKKFEDMTIYNIAAITREFTKSSNAYPYLTGELQKSEVALPIQQVDKMNYGLGAGIDYAKKVWNYKNANWTNPSTQPQWYASVLRNNYEVIISNAVQTALKEV